MGDPVRDQIRVITERLQTEFNQLPAQQIAGIVEEEAAEFAEARIWDYVPFFIEREARRRLTNVQLACENPSGPPPATPRGIATTERLSKGVTQQSMTAGQSGNAGF